MRMKKIVFFVFFQVLGLFVLGQDIQFTANAKTLVTVGETFNLTFSVNGQGTNFKGPNIQGFDKLSGPNLSSSTSVRYVNGKAASSFSQAYSYFLVASREGTFSIPPASITVNNQSYQSNSISIKVVKGSSSGQKSSSPGRDNSGVQSGPNDVFLKAFASNASPLQGEGIVVTYKIFTKVPINQITINKLSSFQGFWSQNLIKENEKFNQYSQTVDGEKYLVADIRKIALFPLKSGKLVIEPLEMECVAQIKRQTKSRTGDPFFDDFFNDSFFSDAYATVEKSLKSNALVINVRPLPTADKPVDFSGAVGDFTFKTEIDKTKLKTNDAITLRCIVSGKGNLQLIDKLNITFPPDFETYDPKVTNNITTSGTGVSGNQTFEYLIIPRRAGKFRINPISFTWFDLTKKRYITSKSPVYDIEVEKGAGDANTAAYSGGSKEDIQYIGNDIRHIRKEAPDLNRIGNIFFGSFSFFLLLVIPLLAFLVLVFYWKKQERKRSDGMLMKNLKATKIARKRLKKANDFLREKKQEAFYDEIAWALSGYISDKFGIPVAELSMDSVNGALTRKNLPPELVNQFIGTLNDTEYARFAPGEKALIMENIYQKALEIIMKIEKELR